MDQVEQIAKMEGRVVGFINCQGVLNNAQRIRGQQLFLEMLTEPDQTMYLLECITTTMIDATKLLQQCQNQTGVNYSIFTVSNCLVNMLSPDLYHKFILPFDQRIACAFETFGNHNCVWNANPYLDEYATVPKVGYIDMGIESDLEKARVLFPGSRRSLIYTPMDIAEKPIAEIRKIWNTLPCIMVHAIS